MSAEQSDLAPSTVKEVLLYLDGMLSKKDKEAIFDCIDDGDLVRLTHRTLGLWIRNKWLWGNPSTPLRQELAAATGSLHPDEYSSYLIRQYRDALVGGTPTGTLPSMQEGSSG